MERIRELEHELRESREIIKKLKGSEEKYRSIMNMPPMEFLFQMKKANT